VSDVDRVVLHIGVPKTATTAVQSVLSSLRDTLARHGVRYPGTGINQVPHLRAPLDWPADEALAAIDAQRWARLQRQVGRGDRSVISAENVAVANDLQAARIVEALGGQRVHVVITLRSLGAIVPAAYQEDVKAGVTTPFDEWLDAVCADSGPQAPSPARFWGAHDHAAIVERWVSLVGPERLTVVVVDSSQPDEVFRAFDDLLDLPSGTVDPSLADHGNRSLTAAECALVRRLNDMVGGQDELTIRRRIVPAPAIWAMIDGRTPSADEQRLTVAPGALERLAPISADVVARLRSTRCRVVGDVERLIVAPPHSGTDELRRARADMSAVEPHLPVEAAALFVSWLLRNGAASAHDPGS
jgi:hypothetical protein